MENQIKIKNSSFCKLTEITGKSGNKVAGAVPETKTMELLCRAKAAQSTDQALSKQDAVNWAAALLDVEIRSKETFPYLFLPHAVLRYYTISYTL